MTSEEQALTAIDILFHDNILRAFVHIGNRLSLCSVTINIARSIENLLQRVVFPTENVIGMVGITCPVAEGPLIFIYQ